MDLNDVRFDAYTDAASRCRWFFLVTALLCGLILSHLYIEVMSFQEAQLSGVYGHRLKQGTDIFLKEAEKEISNMSKAQRGSDEKRDLIDRYGSTKFSVQVTDNAIKTFSFGDREIPIFGFSVPANDYVPILSIFLVVFAIGLWLNLRSLLNIVSSSDLSRNLKKAIHFHFTFTGVRGSNSGVGVAAAIQYFSIWLPALTLAAAIPIDFIHPYLAHKQDPSIYIGPEGAIQSRGITMGIAFLILLIVAVASSKLAATIDRTVHPEKTL